jgi:hypothetical protein
MKKYLVLTLFALFIFSGCATHLQYLRIDPTASSYVINSVGVMPFQNALQIPSVNDKLNSIFVNTLTEKGLYTSVVPPDRVQGLMTNEKVLNAVTSLRTRLQSVGTADPKVVSWFCSALKCDAIFVGDVTQWNQVESGNNKLSTAGLNLKLVAKDGKVLWHATHSSTYTEQYGWMSALADTVKGGADDSALDKAAAMVTEAMVAKLPGADKK